MSNEDEEQLHRAIGTISQSDPLIKLLQQVRLGRMKGSDAGLRAVTESWLGVYTQVLKTLSVSPPLSSRLDPAPRIAVLVELGVVGWDDPAVRALQDQFARLRGQVPG
ncbi:MAG: hypothetical protein KF814_02685 [Nitrospiraceae bacterium]|nr:hypothetical protein [Nitrospiraceae bacterium]